MEPNETLLGTRLFGEFKIFEALKSMKKHQKIRPEQGKQLARFHNMSRE